MFTKKIKQKHRVRLKYTQSQNNISDNKTTLYTKKYRVQVQVRVVYKYM